MENLMSIFRATGMKEFKKIAAINNGRVAILMETKFSTKKNNLKYVWIVQKPRQFSIKMNELKMVNKSFNKIHGEQSPERYFRFKPLGQKFEIFEDRIRLIESGEEIMIKTVPYYDTYLDKE